MIGAYSLIHVRYYRASLMLAPRGGDALARDFFWQDITQDIRYETYVAIYAMAVVRHLAIMAHFRRGYDDIA